jgi:hypothetical protein
MAGLKEVADALDLLIKAAIAAGTFFIYTQAEKQAEFAEKMANATKNMAEAKQTTQGTNLVIVNRLLDLFSDIRKDCLSDDRMYMVTFLVEVNNTYNDVKFKPDAINSILTAEQHCQSRDATAVKNTALGAGSIPLVTPQNIQELNNSLKSDAPVQPIPSEAEVPDGYVAVGSPTVQNFIIVAPPGGLGDVGPRTLLKAKWSVYLRSNTENTETGNNAIRGLIQQNNCVRVLKPYPGIRGQTWAAVKLAACS